MRYCVKSGEDVDVRTLLNHFKALMDWLVWPPYHPWGGCEAILFDGTSFFASSDCRQKQWSCTFWWGQSQRVAETLDETFDILLWGVWRLICNRPASLFAWRRSGGGGVVTCFHVSHPEYRYANQQTQPSDRSRCCHMIKCCNMIGQDPTWAFLYYCWCPLWLTRLITLLKVSSPLKTTLTNESQFTWVPI